jgi:carboxymethylenebutenolidase
MCTDCEKHDVQRRDALRSLAGGIAAILVAGEARGANTPRWDVRQSPSIVSTSVSIPLGGSRVSGFLAQPVGSRRRRSVLIMHGNPGISDDVTNTAAQLAVAGFAALAVDWARDGQDWRALGSAALGAQQIEHARAALEYLRGQPLVRGQASAFVGFCGGARTAFEATAQGLPLACIVSFYGAPITRMGGPLPTRDAMTFVNDIDVPVQGHYGLLDEVAPAADARPFFETLRRRQQRSELFVYENAGHRFYNMTVAPGSDPGFDFVPDAAIAAHRRMVTFLRRTMT